MEKNFNAISEENPPPYSENPPPYGFVAPPNGPGTAGKAEYREAPHIQAPPVTIVQQVIVGDLGKEPRRMNCPHCHAEICTRVKYREGATTHIAALLCCIIGGLLCCWIPYCIDDCKDAVHECPNCNMQIGSSRG